MLCPFELLIPKSFIRSSVRIHERSDLKIEVRDGAVPAVRLKQAFSRYPTNRQLAPGADDGYPSVAAGAPADPMSPNSVGFRVAIDTYTRVTINTTNKTRETTSVEARIKAKPTRRVSTQGHPASFQTAPDPAAGVSDIRDNFQQGIGEGAGRGRGGGSDL
jgi:hypothetical protein